LSDEIIQTNPAPFFEPKKFLVEDQPPTNSPDLKSDNPNFKAPLLIVEESYIEDSYSQVQDNYVPAEDNNRRHPTESVMSHTDQLRLRDYTIGDDINLS